MRPKRRGSRFSNGLKPALSIALSMGSPAAAHLMSNISEPASSAPDLAAVQVVQIAPDSPAPPPTAAATPTSVCALCRCAGELKKSHIIPNSFFKVMKKDGKLVRFDFDEGSAVRLSIESWWEHLLCADCEERFSALETRWVPRLRHAGEALAQGRESVEIADFDYQSLRSFLLSILWRAAVSSLEAFEQILLTRLDQEQLRAALLSGSTSSVEDWSIRLARIVDSRNVLAMDQLALQPVRNAEMNAMGFRFIFGGFVIDFFLEKGLRSKNFMRPGSAHQLNSVAMTDVPQVMAAGVIAIDKNKRGLDKRRRT